MQRQYWIRSARCRAARRESSLRCPGTSGVVRRARNPRPAQDVAAGRGPSRALRGAPDQDMGDAGCAPPADARRGGRLPVADRSGTVVGTAELAALLRRDAETARRPSAARRARRSTAPSSPAKSSSPRSQLRRELRHVGDALRSGWGTLLKPLAWQGDLCFGPSRGNRTTFMRPEDASSRWAGVPGARRGSPGRDGCVLRRLRAGDDRRFRQLACRRLVREATASGLVRGAPRTAGRGGGRR